MPTHARAALLSIGDELTLGQSLDTNSRWIAEQLLARNIVVAEHCTVPDDQRAIADAIRRLVTGVDLLIATGGLGATRDDLVRPALAEALGDELVEDAAAVEQIELYFSSRGRQMPPINRLQALRPSRAAILANPYGTAPGIVATADSRCDIFCLPGPPREMQPMFEQEVAQRLRPQEDRTIRTRLLHTHGLSESEIAMLLDDLMERTRQPVVGTTASEAIVTCRLRYEGPQGGADGMTPDDLIADTERQIRERLDPYIFGEDGQSLAAAVIDLLRTSSLTLSVVESCTGGMLGEMITEVPGASDVFLGGWITYTNESKKREVGVPPEIFIESGPGAVSNACAVGMALGGLRRSGAGACLAITGIAGPGGGSLEKPVGTVSISVAFRGRSPEARRFLFPGSRKTVREWSGKAALGLLRLHLLGRADLPLLGQQE